MKWTNFRMNMSGWRFWNPNGLQSTIISVGALTLSIPTFGLLKPSQGYLIIDELWPETGWRYVDEMKPYFACLFYLRVVSYFVTEISWMTLACRISVRKRIGTHMAKRKQVMLPRIHPTWYDATVYFWI